MKPHSSFRVTTPYVRMSTATVSNHAHRVMERLTKLSPSRFGISFQQFVYDSVEIHQASILPQVILWFSKENIRLTVAASDADFPRLRQRAHYFDLVVENCQKLGQKSRKLKGERQTFKSGSIDWEWLMGRFR